MIILCFNLDIFPLYYSSLLPLLGGGWGGWGALFGLGLVIEYFRHNVFCYGKQHIYFHFQVSVLIILIALFGI